MSSGEKSVWTTLNGVNYPDRASQVARRGAVFEPSRGRLPPPVYSDAMHDALIDRFGRRHSYLRVSLGERCNLRCTYCMPADGLAWTPRADLLTDDEVVRLTALFVRLGVRKVRLTGGEPLARRGVGALVRRIGAVAGVDALGITTNGLLLERHLPDLLAAGARHVNVSLDTLRPDRFERITRRPGLERVLAGLDATLEAGCATRLNAVLLRGVNDDEATDLAALSVARPLGVRFIELMPFDGNAFRRAELVPMAETRARIEAHFGPLTSLPDAPESTAQTFRIAGARGTVGFVASMTAPFCAGCTRLRLTADGSLKVCLFGAAEVSLRDALRSGATDADLIHLIADAVAGKHARHAGLDALPALPNRPMIAIGG